MSFEQDFPSLKGRHFIHDADIMPVFNCYSDTAIKEFCLDKAKVKEAIERKEQWHKGECRGFPDCSICLFLRNLKKDLGLE